MRPALRSVYVAMLLLVSAAFVQSQMAPPSPAPELKKLDFLAGNWNDDADIKSGPMGAGGKMTITDKNDWMPGGFFLELRSTFTGAMGSGSDVAYMGYDSDEKKFTYDEFSSTGEHEHSTGTVDGDTWTWLADEKVGAQTMKGRYTMKVLSGTSYTFKFELSPDGSTWNTVMDGKATKAK